MNEPYKAQDSVDRVKADFQNHWTTKSRVLDPNNVADRVLDALGQGGLCGLVNYNDRRYEAFAEQAERLPMAIRLANAVYFAGRDVLIVKGQEIRTVDGDLLVMALRENVHLKHDRYLEDSIKEAKDNNGVVIITTPFFGSSKVGKRILEKPSLLEDVDAIEVHNGEAFFGSANERAKALYEKVKAEHSHLGQLASSDGHTFWEVGSSYTEIFMPHYSEFTAANNLSARLRQAVRQSKDDEALHKSISPKGALLHAGILLPMIAASKLPKALQPNFITNRGDKDALR